MSKRSQGHGIDETSRASEGLVSNPLVYPSSSSDDNNIEEKTNELHHTPQQSGDTTILPNDGNPVSNETTRSIPNRSQEEDALDSSSDSTFPTNYSVSQQHSPQQSPSLHIDQSNDDTQSRKRQLTTRPYEDHSSDPTSCEDDGDNVTNHKLENDSASISLPLSRDDEQYASTTDMLHADHVQPRITPEQQPHSSSIFNGKEDISQQDDSANTDQEVPPLHDDLGIHQNMAWMPQNEQSLCEFSHTITGYSQKRDSGCKKAEYSDVTVDDQGNKWRLIVYVNGNGRASNHHLSLFLQVADAEDLPFGWKKAVSYVLTLEHPGGGGLSYAKRNPDKTFKLCPKAIDWGWSQFITSDKIQQEGFLQNDSLVVRASVTVKSSSVTIDAEDAEIYLKCAVEEGKPDAVQLCLDQGASVNCQFKDDLYTPLHTACSISPMDPENGEEETAKGPSSPAAPLEGSMEVMELLLQKGADGNASNKWKETPLLIAANNGHKNAVEALLKYGADPALCSEAGWSALTFAAHKGYDEIVEMLVNARAPINCRVCEDLSTPLHKACAGSKLGHLNSVKLLLDGGADVHALNKWRETPLLTAANHGQAGAVEALLRAGADPCKCTDTGWSPLSIAAYKGHNDVVKLLLEEGAPTEEADPTLSALLQAATKGLPDTVELLLLHGADHTVTTKKGDTALSILVEQNLIDAAVDMVTLYKASIPRCSRDRKKVQKARLLINLRLKQQQRQGISVGSNDAYNDASDDSEDGIHVDGESFSIHTRMGGSEETNQDVQGRRNTKKISAEEQAKAAEEALLMELELEDAERNKHEKEANKKLAKKRKKKERERQLKKEQEEKRLAEERAEEEKRRKEAQVQEAAEKAKRERLEAAARKKQEREFRQRREEDIRQQQHEDERRRTSKEDDARNKARQKMTSVDLTLPNGRKTMQEHRNEETPKTREAKGRHLLLENESSTRAAPQISARPRQPNLIKKRGWESLPRTIVASQSVSLVDHAKNTNSASSESPSEAGSVGTRIAPMDAGFHSTLGPTAAFFESPSPTRERAFAFLEPPAVAVFRREKILELLHRCSLSHLTNDGGSSVDASVLRKTLSRWITRAAHEQSECFDFIIPSWVDIEKLTSFFQRQFITESRTGIPSRTTPNMESLKEAGSKMAILCQTLAKSVLEFRLGVEKQITNSWNDVSVGMSSSEIVGTPGGPNVIVEWSNQSQIHLPISVFRNLKERYRGPTSRLLSSIFVSKVCYDTIFLLGGDSPIHLRLLPATKAKISLHLRTDFEIWSDPFSVAPGHQFWGRLPNIDQVFGGTTPFSVLEENDQNLLFRGGSVLLFVPSDSNIATRYIRHAVGILLSLSSIPLSFAIFLRPDCLVDQKSSVSIEDLYALDPRLRENGDLIRRVECLDAGRHVFFSETVGAPIASSTGSLFIVLQNHLGSSGYIFSDMTISEILDSMKFELGGHRESSASASLGLSRSFEGYNLHHSLWASPSNYIGSSAKNFPASPLSYPPAVGVSGGTMERNFSVITNSTNGPFPSNDAPNGNRRAVPRRGRLFDLVDDGGEEDNMNDVVSGMLGTLNVDLFQNTGVQDVDIEAISLMGIGGSSGPPSNVLQPRGGDASSLGRFR